MKSTWEAPYKFNGKEKDEETGLYYYGARYYSPELSMWLSVDPMSDKYPGRDVLKQLVKSVRVSGFLD